MTSIQIQNNELLKIIHNNINNKIWLDRLVQRFEVTKKLYEEYFIGFRKGRGHNNLIKLYWLFALVLSIYYSETNQIKYLNKIWGNFHVPFSF